MSDFLLELACEEIPARMQAKAAEQLAARFADGLKGRVSTDKIEVFATPRRLALIATGLPDHGAAVSEERRGPRADAPAQALEGFLRSTGMTRDQLEERETPKGVFLYANLRSEGRPTAELLAELIPQIIRDFDWPKSMRWGPASVVSSSPRWVRPLTGIIALLGDHVVPFEIAGITSGRSTRGHRFMSHGSIEIAHPRFYAAELRDAHVILDPAERRDIILTRARKLATDAGLTLIEDDGLATENAGLTEWPVPLLGKFDPAFLDVPPEVIQLTMRTNQKYFAAQDANGKLAPVFIAVANIEANDGGAAIAAGNARVLSARLSDAKFFWDGDVAKVKAEGLEAFTPKLADIVFHEKLGTVADKVERVAKLARYLAAFIPGCDADQAEHAARLCKADLTTGTVGEFPEVQGLAGGYLARAAGLPNAVADAIRDHYKPVGQGDDVPTAPVSVAVALADKLDTVVQFFDVDEMPSGSRDPFALRRAVLGIISLIIDNGLRLELAKVFVAALHGKGRKSDRWPDNLELLTFFGERLKVQQRAKGVRHDLIDAVYATGAADLVRLLARVHALQAFLATPDGANLLAGAKRAANILRIEEAKDGAKTGDVDAELLVEPAESALAAALATTLPVVEKSLADEDFAKAMQALSALRAPVDAFFDAVIVNAPDPALRINRLNLLNQLRNSVQAVADFSKIEG
ncbi:glycine--tRNA ligase subunit beta [Polymorphobacter arshaanensis]|uniref:Glycine--tRNA ligase beta subunit n=1 Tax=Glacieibacterium arshaanense TaxID=2511025 RepID=A0A4Y9EQY3_9SPHN|nr:glycine--tRNA ligase subunit beta [Polymorphobacter arshaanensis]TFU06004.1 glycine--tRNA ligase subunit beta [Polymorphobacter arshaanensis]